MRAVKCWLEDGHAAGWKPSTILDRRQKMSAFAWWLESRGVPASVESLDPLLIREFLAYLREDSASGRFGRADTRTTREARPATRNAYFRVLRAFGNWCVGEGLVERSFCSKVKPPQIPKDRKPPLYGDEVRRLFAAAKLGRQPERDAAILLLLLDTGLRASELISLNFGSIAPASGELTVIGKGGKARQVYMGREARRALWRYLEVGRWADRGQPHEAEEPLFVSCGGNTRGERLTKNGLFQIVQSLGKAAGIEGVGPHDLRRTFAVNFLKGGGNVFELQQIMGHTDLTVLREYVELAETDLSEAHRRASPVDRMRLR